jgi:hypothetical protein
VWQAIYEELKGHGFVILGVSLDTAGDRAAATFTTATDTGPFARNIPEGMKLAQPTYPLLRDEQHVVAELYEITNVPMAVWIDEHGRVVRPAESAGSYDVVKHIDVATFAIPEEITQRALAVRQAYFDAVRDWVKNGAKSRFALSADEVARRAPGVDANGARAHACFALGAWLWRHGQHDASRRWLEEAVTLQPDNWAFRRQKIAVADDAAIGNYAATPEFWQEVQRTAKEGKRYYDLIDMPGMPRE